MDRLASSSARGDFFFLELQAHLAVERGDTDAQHAGGFFAGTSVVFEGFADKELLLFLHVVRESHSDGEVVGGFLVVVGDFDLLGHLGREIDGTDATRFREGAGALHGVLQLPDIAGPTVSLEETPGVLVHFGNLGAGSFGILVEEMIGEELDILDPAAQRRNFNGDDGDFVKEIFPERAGLDALLQGFGGGGDETHIHFHRQLPHDPTGIDLLQVGLQLGLEPNREHVDFLQENGATGRAGEDRLGASSGGAEKFRLEKIFGQGGALQHFERSMIPMAGVVDAAGDHLFAGPELPFEQDGRVVVGDLVDDFQNFLNFGAVSDHAARGLGDGGELERFAGEIGRGIPLLESEFHGALEDGAAAEVFIEDPDNVAQMRERLQGATTRPLIFTDWQQRNETFFSALQVERVVMFVILSMIILVAAFNIISSLVMLVKDKGRDIAVLRTMGATRGSIMRIFSMTGTAIGVIGTGVGLVLGLILAANAESLRAFISNTLGVTIFPPEVFFLSTLPSKVNPTEVTVVVCLALGLSFLATIYPAWRAAQYDPVEALRYE